MKKGRQHILRCAMRRIFRFLQPKQAACIFIAFSLAFSLFPVYAIASDSTLTIGSGSTSESQNIQVQSAQTSNSANTTLTNSGMGTTTRDASSSSYLPTTYSSAVTETITLGTQPLNLIQNGSYQPLAAPAIPSSYASSNTPSTTQRAQITARINTALMNVSYGTYNGQTNWCIVDVSDIKAPIYSNATAYAKTLVEEVINDNPDLFYAGSSYGAGTSVSYSSSGNTIILAKILIQYYYPPSTIASMKTKYESGMQTMLSWVSSTKSYKSSTDAEKAKAIHDWLVRNCSYNTSAASKGGPTGYGSWDPWSAYGAIVNKKPVCEGYSLAFMAAMQRLGIQASFVTNNNHGWNRVRLKVGSSYYWYNLDITWDDPLPDKGYSNTPSTTWFLKSDTKTRSMGSSSSYDSSGTHKTWTPSGTSGTNTTFDSTWGGGIYPLSSNVHTVTSISLYPTSLGLSQDSSATLTLSASGTNVVAALAKWTSSNPSVVSVSSNGKVTTGSKTGSATITVNLGGKTATCVVSVGKVVTSASLAPNTQQTASNQYNNDKTYTYKSSVARRPALTVLSGSTVLGSSNYSVTYPSDSINPGVKTATVKGSNGYTGTTSVNYTIKAPLSSVGMSSTTITTTYNGQPQKLAPTLTFKGSLNKTITLKEGTDYTLSFSPSDITNVGTKTVTITGRGAWTGTKTYKLVIKAPSSGIWSRLWGSAALDTMAAITKTFGTASTAVVAVNTDFKDSLAAAALAGSLNAPLLTTAKGSLSAQTKSELTRMGVKTVYIIGSTSQISSTTEKQIKALSAVKAVKRISGSSASARAVACSKTMPSRSSTVIIATQANFKDALSISPYAYATRSPILYIEANKKLSTATINYIKSAKFNKVIIVGGPVPIPKSVETQIKNIGISSTNITRLAGSNEYKTSRIIAEWALGKLSTGTGGGTGLYQYASIKFQPSIKLSANKLGIARADRNDIGWKDALAGSALCGKNGSVVLLADAKNSAQAEAFIRSSKTQIIQGYIFGGTSAIPSTVYNKLVAASR